MKAQCENHLIKSENIAEILVKIRKEFKEYAISNNIKSIIIGVSGGIDSALIVAICKPVCDQLSIPIRGLYLPCDSNKNDEEERAIGIGLHACPSFQLISIQNEFECLRNKFITKHRDDFSRKIREGNIKARIRMICLYDLASHERGMVMSTDNLSELLLGFWTRYGDEGDYAPIREMFKTEVYRVSKYIAENELTGNFKHFFERCINAVPTDGLGITNSDLDQLGTNTYEEVDELLIDHILEGIDHSDSTVIKRFYSTEFKRSGTIHIKREKIIQTSFIYTSNTLLKINN